MLYSEGKRYGTVRHWLDTVYLTESCDVGQPWETPEDVKDDDGPIDCGRWSVLGVC
jgi:hypothetical protein